MVEIKSISNTDNQQKKAIMDIAKSLPEFFDEMGLKEIADKLDNHMIFGSFDGQKLVGFVTYRQSDSAALELSWLAVSRESQGQGIGYDLVKSTLNQLSEKGFKICYVKTLAETDDDAGYAKTRAFYKSLGFNTLEIISPYPYWSGDNPCQILAVVLPLNV